MKTLNYNFVLFRIFYGLVLYTLVLKFLCVIVLQNGHLVYILPF